ncbi:MAG: radical SAM protein [Candidatus Thiodiazotropha sp. (ex Epidulcina cf. delphinae)]|nr:radical SAM protein [Candidatus Thiodiazotropha sp. (ex Epidulcina cf. delphinae)]
MNICQASNTRDHPSLHVIPIDQGFLVIRPITGDWAVLNQLAREIFAPDLHAIESQAGHYRFIPSDARYERLVELCEFPVIDPVSRKEPKPLEMVILKVTNRCNQACRYCYDATGSVNHDQNAAMLMKVVAEALPLSGEKGLSLLFHGGEPLMKFELIKKITRFAQAEATKLGKTVRFLVQTNGSILTDRAVSFLSEYDFGIGVSLDGWSSLHDKYRVMRNGSGTYHLFERNFMRYREFFMSRCGVMTTVSAGNVDLLYEVIRHFQTLGFRTWNCTLYDMNGRGAECHELAVDADRYCESMERVIAGVERGEFDNVAIHPLLSLLDNLLTDQRTHMCMPGAQSCGAAQRLVSVSADGSIDACDIVEDRSLSLGHVKHTTLQESLGTPNAKKITTRHELHLTRCHHCTWLGVCGGTCLGRSSLHSINSTDCRISMRMFEYLLRRLAASDGLLAYYNRFPKPMRRANALSSVVNAALTRRLNIFSRRVNGVHHEYVRLS